MGDGEIVEIGSEFCTNSISFGKNDYFEISSYPKRYTLSGRTGLNLIAEELKAAAHNVLLPDYCCGSMVAPFARQGFNVSFYNAFDLNNVVIDDTVDAVLLMDYFGFLSEDTVSFALRCRETGKTIIVDATQTAFSYSKTYELADYIVVSYRKWFDSLCAVVYSKRGFTIPEYRMEHLPYSATWRKAAALKEKYIRRAEGDKQEFLTLFSNANRALDADYAGYKSNASEITIMKNADSDFLRCARRENAKTLMNEVKKISDTCDVRLVYADLKDEDCPLFVPILVNECKRDFIRAELIKNNIYCPTHWPVDNRYPYKETLYHKKELSLLCDQRYGIDEMRMQIAALVRALDASIK